MKRKSLLFLLLFALMAPWAANAQTVTIGTGTGTANAAPIDNYYNYSFTEMLYSASEIGNPSVNTITSVGFESTNGANNYEYGITIYMKNIADNELGSSFVAVSSSDIVYSGTVTPTAGWVTIDLDNAFTYDNTQNLLIAVNKTSGSYAGSSYTWNYTTTTNKTLLGAHNDGSAYNPTSTLPTPSSYGFTGTNRPNVQLTFGAPATCAKPQALAATANGQSATLTWTSDATQFAVAHATDATANPSDNVVTTVSTTSYTMNDLALDQDHYFWVRANCSATDQSGWTGPVSVHIGYCVPAPTSVDNDGITNVTFGMGDYVVNNDTPKATYTDYHTQIGAVQAGVEATIAITFKTSYTYNTYVWVDLDNSLTFDADEVVCYGESTSSNPTTLTLNFTIPADQTLGDFRMRIGSADSGLGSDPANANPCYSSSFACFQDYTLRVLAAPTCLIPSGLALTASGTTVTATWDGTADTYNIDINGTVTNNVTSPYTFTGELATTYVVKVQANCGGDNSEWGNPASITTDLCMPENMCALTFVLNDSYGDGWSNSVINVIDVATSEVIAAMTAPTHGGGSVASSDTYTLNVCDGRALQFEWVNGGSSWDYEASYVVSDVNGEVIFEGSGAMSAPVNYTVNCTITNCKVPTNVTVSDITAHEATVTWTENGEATQWVVRVGRNEYTVNETTYTITGLDHETQYSVEVRPVCDDADDKWSEPVSFKTDVACPAPSLSVTDVTTNSAVINWAGSGDYELRYATVESRRETLYYDFENGFGDWTTIDGDGDGYSWFTLSDLPNYTTSYGTDLSDWANGGSDAVLSGSYINGMSVTSDPDNLLISPLVTLGGSITFYAKGLDSSYPEHFGVCVSTTGNTDASDFEVVQEWDTETDTEYHEYTVDLSAYSGLGYIAFRDFNVHDMYIVIIDDVTIEEGVTGELDWSEPITGVTSPYTLTDLDDDTRYMVQVRANCGEEGYSDWAQIAFRTHGLCDLPNTLEADATAYSATLTWTGYQENGYNLQWRTAEHQDMIFFDNFNSGTDWWSQYDYGTLVYFTAGDNIAMVGYGTTDTQYLISGELPEYESGSVVKFDHRLYNYQSSYTSTTFQIGFSSTTADVEAFTFGSDITVSSTSFTEYSVEIPTGTKYIAIRSTAEGTDYGLMVDNFGIYGPFIAAGAWNTVNNLTSTSYELAGLDPESEYEWQVQGINCDGQGNNTEWTEIATFETPVACAMPENLVAEIGDSDVIMTWESDADSFEIEVNDDVFTVNTNTYTFEVEPETIYYVRVRTNCGNDGYSEWTEYYAFVSNCDSPKDLPYTYGFEADEYTEYLSCWSYYSFSTANSCGRINMTNNELEASEGDYAFMFSSIENDDDNTYDQVLISPELNAENGVTVQFDYIAYNTTDGNETFMVGYSTDGDNFTWGDEIEASNIIGTDEWETYTETFPAGTKYVAIYYTSYYLYYLFVDNFRFTEAAGLTQTIELAEGWNWFSSYVAYDDPVDMLDALKEGLGTNADYIMSLNDDMTEFDGEEWWGDLDEIGISNDQMYMILANTACEVELQGEPVNPADYEITINEGWNWIGFPSAEALDFYEAMAEFPAEEGDIVQSPNGITEFDGEEWWGDIDVLEPGVGLMYFSVSDKAEPLVFQTTAKAKRANMVLPSISMNKTQKIGVQKNINVKKQKTERQQPRSLKNPTAKCKM